MERRAISLLMLGAIVLASAAFAGVPRLINYQGILTDSGGVPLDGTHDLMFKVYADSSPASPYLWAEMHEATDVDQGLFNVILGSTTTIPDSLFADGERWIGIAVDSDPEMTPRMKITSVPWALRAARADTALAAIGAGDGHSLDAVDGSPEDVVYVDEDGDVGIGTPTPADRLDVLGNLRVSGAASTEKAIRLVRYHDALNYHTIKSIADGNSGLQISTYLNGHICLVPGGMGKVGIGNTIPVRPLDVTGTAKMDGFWLTASPGDGYVLTSDATGVGTWQPPAALPDGDWTISGDDMYAAPSGDVGIGVTSPECRLHVESVPDAHSGKSIIGRVVPVASDLQQLFGVMGETQNPNSYANSGAGVYGRASSLVGGSQGVRGDAVGPNGRGVFGWGVHTSGVNYGIYGTTDSPNGFAGYFTNGKSYMSGPLGIGTEDPAIDLEIWRSADDFVGLFITNPSTGSSSSEGIYFENEDGTVTGIRLYNTDQMSVFNNRPSGYISFSSGGSQRMVITNAGRVGIGTPSPGSDFHVDGTIQIGSAETLADSGSLTIACNSNFVPQTDGTRTLGISTKRWSAVWAVDGTINTSDMRLKQDVSDVGYGLREIMRLRPVSFRWRDRPDAGLRLGLVAQEVEPVMSEVVVATDVRMAEDEAGGHRVVGEEATMPAENLGIYYSQLVPVLIRAVQEQQGLIEDQAAMINRLEARISRLEGR